MRALKFAAAAVATACSLAATPARAGLGLDVTSGTGAAVCGFLCATGKTTGWTFALLSTMRVDGLGVWDSDADGLTRDIDVGLWTASGTLLASTTVTAASTQVASANPGGAWRMQGIPSLTLGAGNYVVGFVYVTDSNLVLTNPSVTTDPALSFTGQSLRNNAVSGLQFPDTVLTVGPYFGATLQISPVAEPSSIAMMASGLAVLALLVSQRGRKNAKPSAQRQARPEDQQAQPPSKDPS